MLKSLNIPILPQEETPNNFLQILIIVARIMVLVQLMISNKNFQYSFDNNYLSCYYQSNLNRTEASPLKF